MSSLQKGEAARQAERPPAGLRIEDLDGELRDFAETAAAELRRVAAQCRAR